MLCVTKKLNNSQLNCATQSAAKRNKENFLKALYNGKYRNEKQHYVSRQGTLLEESRN